jgi:hypothetical protein
MKIVALGGTGQLVLHYYAQLYLVGAIQHSFDAVVIDTDEIMPSLLALQQLFEQAAVGAGGQGVGGQLPTIKALRISHAGAMSAFEALTNLRGVQPQSQRNPVRAFFDAETLSKEVATGLFARPSLSSLVNLSELTREALLPPPAGAVVFVGSVIGGTGGGLLEPVIDLTRRFVDQAGIAARLRAVLFGEYFVPDQGRMDPKRFASNQLLVLKTANEALQSLHSFHVVGGPTLPTKVQPVDKAQPNIDWPKEETHPVWQGVKAVEYLLTDPVMEKRSQFLEREVKTFPTTLSLRAVENRMARSIPRTEALINRSVVGRMRSEPWLDLVWGRRLADYVAQFWSIAASVSTDWKNADRFIDALSGEIADSWIGRSERLGMSAVLPKPTTRHRIRPGAIGRLPWPSQEGSVSWDATRFDSVKTVASRAAAGMILTTLRGQ